MHHEVKREMGKDMGDGIGKGAPAGGERRDRGGRGGAPVRGRQGAHPAEQAFVRAADQPDMAVRPLNPPNMAMAMGSGLFRGLDREGGGIGGEEGRAILPQGANAAGRSEEHTSELQSLKR